MNTIKKSQIIEADKLATLYAGELRGLGYTGKDILATKPEKMMRCEFQNGYLSKAMLPVGKLKNWVESFPADSEFELEFSADCQNAELEKGRVKITGYTSFGGRSEMTMLFGTNCETWRALQDCAPIRFDDEKGSRRDFILIKPSGLENLSANLKAAKAGKEFAKLRNAELKAKQDLKVIAGEHCRNLALVAGGTAAAIAQARLVIQWRRLFRHNLKNQLACPAWFNETARGEHGEHLARIGNAEKELADYKPRMKKCKDWQGRLTGETTPIYGPAYDALTNKVCFEKVALRDFIIKNFRYEIEAAGLPAVCGYDKMTLRYSKELRQVSRARIAIRNYAEKKLNFSQPYIEALAARRKAQPKLAAAGGVIKASATLADGRKLDTLTISADLMAKQVEQANEAGAVIHIIESNHPAYPVGDILPVKKQDEPEPVNETHADLKACVAAVETVAAPVASVETPAKPESALAHGYKILPNIRAIAANGETTIERGEFWDAITQTCIESGATEQKPLRLGNVDFWRDGNETCYSIPANQWEAQKVADQLAEILTAKKIASQPESQPSAGGTSADDPRQVGFARFQFGFADVGEIFVNNDGLNFRFVGNFNRKKHAFESAAGKPFHHVKGYLNGKLARGWVVYETFMPEPASVGNVASDEPLKTAVLTLAEKLKANHAKREAQRAAIRSAKLSAVIPVRGELPEPAKPFEISTAQVLEKVDSAFAPDIRVTVAGGIITKFQILTKSAAIFTRGLAIVGTDYDDLRAVCEDLTFESIEDDAAPVTIHQQAAPAPKTEPVLIMAIRKDESGQVINGNFSEVSGPVVLPPIPPRKGSALANIIEAGERLAALMRGEFVPSFAGADI